MVAAVKYKMNKDAIGQSMVRKTIPIGQLFRFVVGRAEAKIKEKDDNPAKVGNCSISLTVNPMADPNDGGSVNKRFQVWQTIVLPIQNEAYPEHKQPDTGSMCLEMFEALELGALPAKGERRGREWILDGQTSSKEACERRDAERAVAAVERLCEIFSDPNQLKQLEGLAFYAVTKLTGDFVNLQRPSAQHPTDRTGRPVPYGTLED